MAPLAALFSHAIGADQAPAIAATQHEPTDIRTLLEMGRTSGAWPAGMIIRVSACLGSPDHSVSRDTPPETKESYEFTSDQVRRIAFAETDAQRDPRPGDSRPFDSRGLCQDLLEGQAVEIRAAQGQGPKVGFIGSPYHAGTRSIEVVWKGENILSLYETNCPFLKLYSESDARAFGALYERLASQARILFQPTPAEPK